MRGVRHPDVFELTIRRTDYDMRTVLEWRSRMFGLQHGLALRENWGCDPRSLADFIERLIGDSLRAWAELNISAGREMAQALQPHWEREIYAQMERMERMEREGRYQDRPLRYNDDRFDALHYAMVNGRFAGFAPTPIDEKAKQKARQLLMRNLDANQEKSFKKDGSFRVTAKDGKTYTIRTARSFNVEGPDGAKYCGQLQDTPIEDQMLAQKLLLEHEPEKFFKNANVSPAMNGTTATAARTIDRMWIDEAHRMMFSDPRRRYRI